MLQPRAQRQQIQSLGSFCISICIIFICIESGLGQNSDVYIVEPTPALRLNSQDLTTILLLNNNNNNNNQGNLGRHYHNNVKPTVGLLTSTARTFIQEGVTTEYATQVLGTTLDNGRLYAQLLKKSSRVLYDKDKVSIAPTAKFPGIVPTFSAKSPKSLLQSHNDIIGDKDWQLIDDHLLLVNKDSINEKNPAQNSEVSQTGNSLLVFPVKKYPNFDEETSNTPRFSNQSFSFSQSSSSTSFSSDEGTNISPQKVLRADNLPTYTIKNVFAPSGFSWDSPLDDTYIVNEKFDRASKFHVDQQPQQRTPKVLQHNTKILNNELRSMATVTYYGFADFTTVVGDTVIIFSPSTSTGISNQGQVTSIKGEATLNGIPQETAFVTHVPITVTQDIIEPTFTMQHVVGSVPPTGSTDSFQPQENTSEVLSDERDQTELTMPEESEDYNSDDDSSTEEYMTATQDEASEETITTTTPKIPEEPPTEPKVIELEPSIVTLEETQTSSTLTPTETQTKAMLSTPSNEDISKIFASLASVEAAKKLAAEKSQAEMEMNEEEQTQTTTENVVIEIPTVTSAIPTTLSGEILENTDGQKPQSSTEKNEQIETTSENISNNEMPTEAVVEVESDVMPNKPSAEIATETEKDVESISPETKVSGGVTTIFFEDDPFLGIDATQIEKIPPLTTSLLPTNDESNLETTTGNAEQLETTTTEPEVDEPEAQTEHSANNDAVYRVEGDSHECQQKTSEIIPTLVPKTLTYLTTFFISDTEQTSTSIESNVVVTFDVSYSTKLFCEEIISSRVVEQVFSTKTESEGALTVDSSSSDEPSIDETDLASSVPQIKEDSSMIITTPRMIVTEKAHVTTEQTPATEGPEHTEDNENGDEENPEEDSEEESTYDNTSEQSGEEIELIYKTLYTTYTYLTTFFHESTTSISSRKEIITNVITSTVNPSLLQSNDVTKLLESIAPSTIVETSENTSTEIITDKTPVAQSDLVRIDNILREDEEHLSTTPSLSDQDIQPSGVKTYYTTYTYFTTIFVDGETEITSRTEIYTNYVTESDSNLDKSSQIEDRKEYIVSDDDNKIVNDITPTRMHHQPVQTNSVRLVQQALSELSTRENHNVIESSFVSAPVSSSPDENEITMVTDIKSSSSDGDRHIIENINKHWNGLLEDQISSESNTEEIIPSSTLLLQTSYTTFTYFTTMYVGNTASSILSRLETITNVVTETLQPTQMLKVEDSTLPITYFTTFTYWTTLYKDGEITTISREQTVSNIVTPTAAGSQIENSEATQSLVALEETITPSSAVEIGSIYLTETVAPQSAIKVVENITNEVSTLTSAKILEPTTFYTTYTYFTTQYIGEETVINSRFETVTNVNTPLGQAAILEATVAQPVSTSSSITPSALDTETTTPSVLTTDEEIIEINHGKIVDAEGISTLLYTTKTIATSINDLRTTVVQSTSLLNVDEVKKASMSSSQIDSSTRTYKTGLVRLIDGTIIANSTTTLYQSKVIGTIIDGRYAQIIESTSSFLVEKTLAPSTPVLDISPTAVQPSSVDVVLQTTFVPTTSPDAIESSINDGPEDKTQDEEENDESDEESETAVDESGRPKSRLTFQTKKKTFTPVIRPFASRNRPQFAPKRKNAAPGSATIITRSDFTPTITATPALKSEGGKGRFSSNRKGSSVILSSGVISGSSRKFSRPGGSSSRGFYSSSAYPSGSRRGFASSKIQPTASSYFGGSSRRGGASSQRGIAGSSNFGRLGSSSIYPGNSRLRIKPSSIIPTADVQSITNLYTTQEPDTNEESATLFVTDQEGGQDQEEIEITTESQRRPNSLLKFRRPPIVAKNLPVSQRRNPLTQRSKPVTTTTSTTPKPQPRSFQRPSIAPFGSRPRAQLGLFPPRTLFKPQNINDDLHETRKQDDDGNDFGDDLEGDEYDDDDEEIDDEELDRNRRNNIKRHVRTKRQAPGFRNRFRRPPAASKHEEKADVVEEEPVTQRSRTTARFSGSRNNNKKSSTQSKNNNGNSRIRPTKASSSTRAQFTLREKDTATKPSRSSSFRRPSNNGSPTSRRTSTTIGRPKAPRLKSFSNSVTESTHSSRSTAGRSRQTTSRGRSTTRSRGTTEYKNIDPVLPIFDGTITVTHHIPTEVTIPVVNGKVTEYKNIVTAQIRTEVLAPNQYNTLVDRAGSSLLVLAREDSTINSNGATEVTQFILHETPTTSVIFTPTTIRGRRTSFSHVIPSTVYDVENVVSTIQPQIAAQAPLANILLSQLLLGNIGLPQQQLNPLIGLGGQTGVPGTPVTEFKTRTTTYVTTVTEGMSTVIPLTFRGKEILTTIFDSTVNVITATEFITDTVVVTPTAAAVQQVNSLLLPLLLQQQAQGAQPVLPIQNSALPQQIINDPLLNNVPSQHQNLFQDNSFGLDSNRIQKVNLDDFHETREAEQFPEQETFREAATETTRSSRKRHHRKGNKHANGAAATPEPQPPMQTLETSVVTLYVSAEISISTTPLTSIYDKGLAAEVSSEGDDPTHNEDEDINHLQYDESGRFFNFQVFNSLHSSTPAALGDEARYNLATRIMSNGVEVIVAGDKSKTAVDRNSVLRVVPSSLNKPMTLAPSTLKNQMILIAPEDSKESLTLPLNPNQFVTKTCLTTYTYRTTYLQDGTTTIESREKVISNIATEERNYLKISPTSTSGVTLSRTPEFVIGVFHTTYTYLNTILDNELPIVLSSKLTVTNTITGPEDYISFLQPSVEATPAYETNTYYSKITLTKTLHDNNVEKVISTSNILRQVVITESLPSKSTSVMTSYIALDASDDKNNNVKNDLHIYATKTYLTTFTYFTTVLKSQSELSSPSTEVNSHIRVVENVITESIPTHLIQQDALSSFREQLQTASTKIITTLAKLVDGETLEVTAMKTPQFHQHSEVSATINGANSQAISSHSTNSERPDPIDMGHEEDEAGLDDDSLKDEENEDNATDNILAESSNHQVYNAIVDPPARNNSKINDKNGFQVSNLIGSLNLNGLNALGPVINAMAGLINTNFGESSSKRNISDLKLSTSEISSKNLLKNITSAEAGSIPNNVNLADLADNQHQQHSPIYIPIRSANNLLNENRLSSPSSLHIAPPKPASSHLQKYLLQSDEKANRNNKLEVAIGKPTYETPLLNGGIPISPGEVITANSDVIIGKPAGVRPRIPFQNAIKEGELKPPLLQSQSHPTSKVIPLFPYRPHYGHQYPPKLQTYGDYKQTYPLSPPSQSPQSLPPIRHLSHVGPPSSQQFHQQHHINYPEGKLPLNNEILEIKRIPEVFSADLPIFEMKNNIRDTDKTMLVNIQPSQVASVMIPHGNTAPVLIIESTAELHKNGQYFDEPSPYPNTIIGEDSATDYAHKVPPSGAEPPKTQNGVNTGPFGSVSEIPNAPVQVSLDSSVLSHNIDVHVPPLTFLKENDFPQSIPVKGQNHLNFRKNGQYNVNIPHYHRHVTVNLKAQHDSSSIPPYHRPHRYPVEGMGPPPKRQPLGPGVDPSKKYYHYYNQRPHNQHHQHHFYRQPPSNKNDMSHFTPYKENRYPFESNILPQHHHHLQTMLAPTHESAQETPVFDNTPIDHSQAPSIADGITDEHRDDDYENEEGEVIQESNSLPVIPGQYIDYPTSTIQTSTFYISPFLNMPSASAINELPHMEINSSHEMSGANISHSAAKETIPETNITASSPKVNTTKQSFHTEPHSVSLGEYSEFDSTTLIRNETILRNPIRPNMKLESNAHQVNFLSGGNVHSGKPNDVHGFGQPPLSTENSGNDKNATSYGNSNKYSNNITPIPVWQAEGSFHRENNIEGLNNNSFMIDIEKESGEIFDYKESINPHNLEVVNNLDQPQSPIQLETTVNIPPPSPSLIQTTSVQHIPNAAMEEVLGMSPPPLPNHTTLNSPLSGLPLRKPSRLNQMGSSRDPSANSKTSTKAPFYSLTRKSTHPKTTRQPTTASTTATILSSENYHNVVNDPIFSINETHPTTSFPLEQSFKKPTRYSSHRLPITVKPSVQVSVSTSVTSTTRAPVTKIRLPSLVLTTKLNYSKKKGGSNEKISAPISDTKLQIGGVTPSIQVSNPKTGADDISIHSSEAAQTSQEDMLNDYKKFPDEILVAGSEQPIIVQNHNVTTSSFAHKETVTIEKAKISTRTRLVSKIVLPTKYITNTKTLTVTTTKTTVIKSQGVPSTQTLILTTTQTSTLVDTVTQTQTETLLQPTKITIDPTTTTQLYTTVTTVYTIPPPHNPEKEPTPPDDVIDDIIDDIVDSSFVETTPALGGVTSNQLPHETTAAPSVVLKVPKIAPSLSSRTPNLPSNQSTGQHDSIFVVMTDQKNVGLINLGTDREHLAPSHNSVDDPDDNKHIDNNLESIDLPHRDEDTINGESNHVLLGGVLIASPPKAADSLECRPDCKGSRSELCQNIDGHMRCVCRAGFARMFPDRPCKPTYTYQLSLPLHRIGKDILIYDESLVNKESETYFNLASLTHEALDRMVMQSDFRDIYHGVHVTGLDRAHNGNGILGKFYLQLSDSSDEQRLVDVFRKYLRGTNYSVGGTELYSAQTSGTDDLEATDFDECLDRQFHDCSESAHCFNLHGTYTCSCKEGFADLSENPVYPGRICSTEQIGCEKCHYHGSCYSRDFLESNENAYCECFPWYAGASCQLNLKILLIALVAFGALLLILLLFCLLITCTKRQKNRSMQAIISGINILPPKGKGFMGSSDKLMKVDKRAMIKDSSSEASNSLDTLPYTAKKSFTKDSIAIKKQPIIDSSQRHNAMSSAAQDSDRHCNLLDQNDRSLTVMIPRAKYHPMLSGLSNESNLGQSSIIAGSSAVPEAKLLGYWDAGVPTTSPSKKLSSASSKQNNTLHATSTGALVSAGFEVSATVGQQDLVSTLDSKSHSKQKAAMAQHSARNSIPNSDSHSQLGGGMYKKQSLVDNNIFMDSIDAWSGTLHHTELTASEVRSYDETTIQPQTKSFLSMYDKQLSNMNNDEANTMAERDVGSTFLLPHTHLYKPDRGSDDISGFDSF